MELYNLTLLKPSSIQRAIYGNFSEPRAHEFIISRGNTLELWKMDSNDHMQVVCSTDVFSQIRSLKPFRPTEGDRDYILVGSDSGRICVLQYNPDLSQFVTIHQETFGKSGVRRIVPGQYLAVDPHGRAIMISAVEKSNIVYVLTRDQESQLTISSPLEANKSQTIIFDTCGVDVGYENPVFAVLEVDYSECDEDSTGAAYENVQKHLTFYQYDLGLNHVIRKWTTETERSANSLIGVPGVHGPGGVLIFAENFVIYQNENKPPLKAVIPRRQALSPERGTMIISTCCLHIHKNIYFFVQSEYGDLYRITLDYANGTVTEIHIKYFDTIPPTTNICITQNGILLATFESGDHICYQFKDIGDDDNVAEALSSTFRNADGDIDVPVFLPRPLTNLNIVDSVPSLCPCTSMIAKDVMNEGVSQLYTLCGKGSRSSLRVLKSGLPITQLGDADLGNKPRNIWTVPGEDTEGATKYIIVSFKNATLILTSGDEIHEDTESVFVRDETTLYVGLLEGFSYIQVTKTSMNQIFSDGHIKKWEPPARSHILCATSNGRQIAVALETCELIYFELDERFEWVEVKKLSIGEEITCLDIPEIPSNRSRSLFLAVGCSNNCVTIYSLAPETYLEELSLLAFPAMPTGIAIDTFILGDNDVPSLFLTVGLETGFIRHQEVDSNTGELGSFTQRSLGIQPIRLVKIKVNGKQCILALAKKPWLSYPYNGTTHLNPLAIDTIDCACSLSNKDSPDYLIGIQGETLHVLSINKLGEPFTSENLNLEYTPRQMVFHPQTNKIFVIESEQNTYSKKEKDELLKEEEYCEQGISEEECGYPITPELGKWASCIEVIDPVTLTKLEQLHFENNECALCCCFAKFATLENELFFVVGTAKDLKFKPRSCSSGAIYVYRIIEDQKLMLFHKTDVEDAPKALCQFQERICVGIGKILRIYDLGKKRLLKKCEYRSIPNMITSIHTEGDRIYVGDICEGYTFLKYHKGSNQIVSFSDSSIPRSLTASCLLDYHTVCGADKMGNIFIERVNPKIDDNLSNPSGNRVLWDTGFLNASPNKNEIIATIHVGEIVTSIQKGCLIPLGHEVLIYSTIMGRIGVLLPMDNRSRINDFLQIEMWLREKKVSLCGRDVISYRSEYTPIKNVIDGDLCEMFGILPYSSQYEIASSLRRSVPEIQSLLEDFRATIL